MDDEIVGYERLLSAALPETRLMHLEKLAAGQGRNRKPRPEYAVNNHIHTTYSFSPYTPALAVWKSLQAGLQIAGIMDHDTMSGAAEFKRAGAAAGIAVTQGVECRVDFSSTPLKGRWINNPDQKSIAYIALHGVPDSQVARIDRFLAPYREERNKRNCLMIEKLNRVLAPFSLNLDYHQDVLPLSSAHQGGTVTERHILYCLAQMLITRLGKGEEVIRFIRGELKIVIPDRSLAYLKDPGNAYYAFDMVNILKSSLVARFYVEATTECPDVREVLALASETGAIPAYAYLGDMTESATEDKKPQLFEDSYLALLFQVIKDLGFKAVTYIPARNHITQLERIQRYCREYDFFQICGEDINSPRQPFICEKLKEREMGILVEAAWSLIGHEIRANNDLAEGFFSARTIARYPSLAERIRVFSAAGKKERRNL